MRGPSLGAARSLPGGTPSRLARFGSQSKMSDLDKELSQIGGYLVNVTDSTWELREGSAIYQRNFACAVVGLAVLVMLGALCARPLLKGPIIGILIGGGIFAAGAYFTFSNVARIALTAGKAFVLEKPGGSIVAWRRPLMSSSDVKAIEFLTVNGGRGSNYEVNLVTDKREYPLIDSSTGLSDDSAFDEIARSLADYLGVKFVKRFGTDK